MLPLFPVLWQTPGFSALQRAEIAEIGTPCRLCQVPLRFSALQRAEIAEIRGEPYRCVNNIRVSVLFNEPKLLKFLQRLIPTTKSAVSVLFNEPKLLK